MKLKKVLLISLAGFFICFLMLQFASTARATIIESTFVSDLEGWTITHGTATWQDDSPDPHAGYLEATDTDSDWMWVHAPDMFLGDLSSFSDGTIGFDSLYTQGPGGSHIVRFGEISLTNNETTIIRDIVPGPLTENWETYEYSLGYSDWGFADEASWQTFLSNITAIDVNLESHSPVVEVVGFDNFKIASPGGPVPEPSAMLLLGFGLVGLLGIGKRKLGGR